MIGVFCLGVLKLVCIVLQVDWFCFQFDIELCVYVGLDCLCQCQYVGIGGVVVIDEYECLVVVYGCCFECVFFLVVVVDQLVGCEFYVFVWLWI